MNKIQVAPLQRANALEALNVMWPSVPPENVFPGLWDWRTDDAKEPPTCGTVACFGGWAEWWPPFKAQIAAMGHSEGYNWRGTVELFGTALVDSRGYNPADAGFEGTDHELVTNRLRWLISNSEVVDA